MSEIKQAVTDISKVVTSNLEADNATGILSEKAKANSYEECLPSTLTMDVVKEVHEYDTNFVAGGLLAAGHMGVDLMKKNTKVDEVSCRLKMDGRNYTEYDVKRSQTYRNGLSPTKEEITKYGVATVGYHVSAGKRSGQLELAMQEIRESANAKLKK